MDEVYAQSPDHFDAVSYDRNNNDDAVDDEDIILRTTADDVVRNEIDEWDAILEKRKISNIATIKRSTNEILQGRHS